MTQLLDGYGQTGTKVYSSIGSAPGPRVGAIIVVDDGTFGALYVGAALGGVNHWQQLATLTSPAHIQFRVNPSDDYQAQYSTDGGSSWTGLPPSTDLYIRRLADGGLNNISSTDGSNGLAIVQTGGNSAIYAHNATASSTDAVIVTDNSTADGAPHYQVFADSAYFTIVNRHGFITASRLAALPSPDSTYAGSIAINSGTGVDDVVKICLEHADTTWHWDNLKGTNGTDGSNGSNGSDGTNGTDGAQGQIQFPDLPTVTTSFQMVILAQGCFLPWLLPPGYTYQITSIKGIWQALNTGASYITDGYGSATHTDNGFPTGRVVSYTSTLDSDGLVLGGFGPLDPFTVLTVAGAAAVGFTCNGQVAGGAEGYLVATVEIVPVIEPVYDWTMTFPCTDGDTAGIIFSNPSDTVQDSTGCHGIPDQNSMYFVGTGADSTTQLLAFEYDGDFSGDQTGWNAAWGMYDTPYGGSPVARITEPQVYGMYHYSQVWDGTTPFCVGPGGGGVIGLQILTYNQARTGDALVKNVVLKGNGTPPSR